MGKGQGWKAEYAYNLKLYSLAVELDGADFLHNSQYECAAKWGGGGCTHKVDADGGDVALGVGVIGKSEQQTRLSNTRISDKEELEEIVVSGTGPSAISIAAATRATPFKRARGRQGLDSTRRCQSAHR